MSKKKEVLELLGGTINESIITIIIINRRELSNNSLYYVLRFVYI